MAMEFFGLSFGPYDLGILHEALMQYTLPADATTAERLALAELRQAIADALEATEE